MKFLVKTATSSGPRLGVMSDFPRLPNVTIPTPGLALYTKSGAVPNLTREVIEMLNWDASMLSVPLATTLTMSEGVEAQGQGLAKFTAMEEYISFLILQDPTMEIPDGHFTNDMVPLWPRTGKELLGPDRYMDLVELYKPDLYLALADAGTDMNASKKRLGKSSLRTSQMFNRCLERHMTSETLSKHSGIIGVITGGPSQEDRARCLEPLLEAKETLAGFALGGLYSGGPRTDEIQYEEIREIVQDVTKQLPSAQLRICQGGWNPVTALELVSEGWDLLDTSAATVLADRGHAFTFSLDSAEDGKESRYCIHLLDDLYKEDFKPILEGCSCLACTKHTRAYVSHLLNTKELLASVLLSIHNLHHYQEFFKKIRQHIEDGTFNTFKEYIAKQYEQYLTKQITKETEKEHDVKKRKLL